VDYHRQYSTLLMSVDMCDEALADINERIEKYSALPGSDVNSQILCDAYLLLGITEYLMSPRTDRYNYYEYNAKAESYYKPGSYQDYKTLNSVNLSAMASKVGTTRAGAMEEYIDCMTRCVPTLSKIWNGCTYGLDDLARGELHFYKADLNNAAKCLNQALRKAEERNQYEVRNRTLFYLLRIALAKGDFAKIQDVLKSLEAQLDMKEYHSRFTTFDIVSSWYYSLINQPNMIAHWILNGDFGKGAIGTFKADFGNFAKAKFYYSDRRYHELISFIESEPTFNNVLFGRLETKALMAGSLYQIKERGAAMTAFKEAYELASTNSLMMPFIELGKDMRTLTRAAMRDKDSGIPGEWLELVSRKSSTYAKRLMLVTLEYKKANNINDDVRLSPREHEVLQDLYEGLSRAEIAANRGLSLSSVKMTLNMVYAKLGANSLADVIRIAVNRNLIKK
jgi:LuxR family maltose regulon positive regulatory protein